MKYHNNDQNVTQRHGVRKCSWKMVLIDSLETRLPPTFKLSRTQYLRSTVKRGLPVLSLEYVAENQQTGCC